MKKAIEVKHRKFMQTPIGTLCLEDDGEAVTGVYFAPMEEQPGCCRDNKLHSSELLERTERELREYFAGERREFDIPLHTAGTPFQERVWASLREIPYGETRSYADVAAMAGNPRGCRAVGGANNKNPIMILTPCHRVIGKDGSLTGFGGGLPAKEYMLALEAACTAV